MRTPFLSLLAFATAVTLLFYLPRLIETLEVGLPTRGIWLGAGLLFGASLLLAAVNDGLQRRLREQPAWLDGLITVIANLVVIIVVGIIVFRIHQAMLEPNFDGFLRRSYRIRVGLSGLLAALYVRFLAYRRRSRAAELANLQLRERDTAARLATLQQKLDPHFLFNTLNTISGAVRQDKREEGLAMIADLAERYRYLLKVSNRSLVTVGEEVDFVEGYARLLGHRFGAQFTLIMRLPLHLRPRNIPPLTLQLLVENAVKHNEISRAYPLEVRIEEADGDRIRVSNPRRPRPDSQGAGEGLANLTQRYLLLAGEDARPRIERTTDRFSVTLPTLPDARPDH